MLPLSLLLWIVFEIACYLAIGRQLFAAGWPTAIAGAIGGVFGLRAGINAITWTFGMALASPAPRLGMQRTTRLIIDEYCAYLLTFLLVIPFERLWISADRLPRGSHPVLLVHGYGCSRGVWWLLRRRLERAGHVVATVSLFPPFTSLGKLVPQLNARIETVCAATGSRQVTLVAHSMGGLICRSYLARHGGERVDRLLTLATPHQGTELARLGLGCNAREMSPGSLWLNDMAREPLRLPAVSLRNPYDNYCMPQDNQRLSGMRDIELPPVGHLTMLYDKRIAQILIECLEKRIR